MYLYMYTHLFTFIHTHTHTHTPAHLELGAEWAAQVDRGKGSIPVADYRLATEIPYSSSPSFQEGNGVAGNSVSGNAVSGNFFSFQRGNVGNANNFLWHLSYLNL